MYGNKSENNKSENKNSVMSAAADVEASNIKEDFAALRQDFVTLRNDLMSLGANKASQAGETLDAQLGKVKKKASKLLAAADEETRAAASAVEKNVRENPVASLSAAVAVGFLLGRSLFRK